MQTDNLPLPPAATRIPHPVTIHGETLEDDYFWLRDKPNPAVAEYLNLENSYTDAVMADTTDLQEKLYKEILGRINETDQEPPYRIGNYWYSMRTEAGKQYPIICRRSGSVGAEETVIFDLNIMAEGHGFFSIGALEISDCGSFAAFSTDTTGFRQYTLQIKNLTTGEVLPDRIEKTGSIAWAADGKTLFYTVEDSAKRHYRVYRHVAGTDLADDVLVFEETDEMFRTGISRSRSGDWLLLQVESHTTSETYVLSASDPTGQFTLILGRQPEKIYQVDHHTGQNRFYIRTNDTGINYRLVWAPTSAPGPENWTEVIACDPAIMREELYCFEKYLVLFEREDGLPHLRIVPINGSEAYRATFPEPTYTVYPVHNHVYDTDTLRYSYQSMVTPSSTFDLDMESGIATLVKQTEVPGGFNREDFVSERLFAIADDGTRIPLSIVRRRDTELNSSAPLFLYGYGSYGISMPAHFSVSVFSLLNRGFVFAIGHIRGGGELGKAWHDSAKMQNKMNTFTDFIKCAETLINDGYADPQRIVIEGGSAGGLLMGAVVNLRPDLFSAVISKVPFVDVINTMLDKTLPLTIGEFEEWGNPKIAEQYAWIRAYCPYTNLKATAYPPMLVKTSFNDSQVMYWEPAKYIARLRTLKSNSAPLLLKTNMDGGHGGSSGRYSRIKDTAFDYAFILKQTGITE